MNTPFYLAILPPEGPYCVVGIREGNAVPSFHDTMEEVIAQGETLKLRQSNAFFAPAQFATKDNRKASNCKSVKSFFIDLDCGPDKPYATQIDASIALRKFVTDTGLPEPWLVNSGRGIHAYWPFNEAVPAEYWLPRAKAFKQMCVENLLSIDLTVTADAARILRMPDTENHKVSPPLPVVLISAGVISDIQDLLKLMPPPVVAFDFGAAREYGVDSMTQGLAGGEFPSTSFARLVRRSVKGKGCAQITNAVTNAATLEEPLWRAALSIAWRCTDASTAVHVLSRAHPGYSPDNTIAKAEATQGPMTCDWYKTNYSAGCAGCQQKCTSPISLGRMVEAAEVIGDKYIVDQQLEPDNVESGDPQTVQVEIPAYPFPYFRGIHGGVFLKGKDAEGDPIEVEIYKHDLYLTSRFYDSDEHGNGEGEVVGVNLHTPHDGIRRFVAPVATLLTKEKMRDILIKHGVVAINKELDNIMAYLASSVRNLQRLFAADRTRNQMGWTPDNTGFVVGELEYTANGVRLAPAGASTREMAPLLTPKGSLEEWTKIANFYDRPGMEAHALAIFFGFGSPLLRLIGGIEVRGAAINLMSNKSGTGKTTVQMVANSIFGRPGALLMKENDTIAAKMQWIGTLNTIVATMDEVTNMTDEQLSNVLYDIPQGRGRHRMESQTNKIRANLASWQTFVIMSSNSSLYDKLLRYKSTSDGEIRRLLELRIVRPLDIPKAESDAIFRLLDENYGVAGPVFMQYVVSNVEKVQEQLKKAQIKIDKDLNLDQSDRFYSVILACAFVAGSIAKKLGLLNIDTGRVYTYALSTVAGIRSDIVKPAGDSDLTAQEALTTYVNDNLNNALIVNAARSIGIPQAPIREPRGPLRIRYEPDTRELWIPSAALRDYFVSRQVDFQQAIKSLTSAGVLKNNGVAMTKRIGSGAVGNFETMGIRCYCIDGTRMGLDTDSMTGNGDLSVP